MRAIPIQSLPFATPCFLGVLRERVELVRWHFLRRTPVYDTMILLCCFVFGKVASEVWFVHLQGGCSS